MLGGIYHDQKNKKNRFVLRLLLLAVFGRTWGITVINDTLLPQNGQRLKSVALKLTLSLA